MRVGKERKGLIFIFFKGISLSSLVSVRGQSDREERRMSSATHDQSRHLKDSSSSSKDDSHSFFLPHSLNLSFFRFFSEELELRHKESSAKKSLLFAEGSNET